VIAVKKALDVFEPYLRQLGSRLSHVVRRLFPIVLYLLQVLLCVIVSLCHCVTVALCHCVTVSLWHCVTVSLGQLGFRLSHVVRRLFPHRLPPAGVMPRLLCHWVTVPACAGTLPLCHCVTVSLCHCVTMSLCHCVTMCRRRRSPCCSTTCFSTTWRPPLLALCHSIPLYYHTVSHCLCHCVTVSLCHCVTVSLSVSPCHCVTVSLSVSLCHCVTVSLQKEKEPMLQHDLFLDHVASSFAGFVDTTEGSCIERCIEDLTSTTRFVSWTLHQKV